jgi:hypothetical protein
MEKMRLSEALRVRKQLKSNLKKFSDRFVKNVSYLSDKEPEFSFTDDLESYRKTAAELIRLEAKIARANALRTVKVPENWKDRIGLDQISLAEAIRCCSEIKSEITLIKSLFLKSGSEKRREMMWDNSSDKSVYHEIEDIWISKMTEKQKDETISLLEEMFSSMDRVIERVNNSSTI